MDVKVQIIRAYHLLSVQMASSQILWYVSD